jgi:hypothetical protein
LLADYFFSSCRRSSALSADNELMLNSCILLS